MYIVYIIKSVNTGRYYVGYTDNISDRIKHHNSGANRSTKSYRPWELIYKENYPDKKSAWLREKLIKSYKGGAAFNKLIKNGCVA